MEPKAVASVHSSCACRQANQTDCFHGETVRVLVDSEHSELLKLNANAHCKFHNTLKHTSTSCYGAIPTSHQDSVHSNTSLYREQSEPTSQDSDGSVACAIIMVGLLAVCVVDLLFCGPIIACYWALGEQTAIYVIGGIKKFDNFNEWWNQAVAIPALLAIMMMSNYHLCVGTAYRRAKARETSRCDVLGSVMRFILNFFISFLFGPLLVTCDLMAYRVADSEKLTKAEKSWRCASWAMLFLSFVFNNILLDVVITTYTQWQ